MSADLLLIIAVLVAQCAGFLAIIGIVGRIFVFLDFPPKITQMSGGEWRSWIALTALSILALWLYGRFLVWLLRAAL